MENERPLGELIDEVSGVIAAEPENTGAYMTRAKLHYRAGAHGDALNDVIKILELDPDNAEARTYDKMIREIFEYRYTDYYNP